MEELIRQKQQLMERSSLTIKEEKATLAEMKKMKDDHKVRTRSAHMRGARVRVFAE